jgi:hypothetical protein
MSDGNINRVSPRVWLAVLRLLSWWWRDISYEYDLLTAGEKRAVPKDVFAWLITEMKAEGIANGH